MTHGFGASLLLGTVWILGVRARYGQNLMVSGFGGYDHGAHRVGGDAPCRQEAGDSGGREGGARSERNPDLLGDLVGGREPDPVDVFRQHVGIAPHLLDCLLAVGLEDSIPSRSSAARTHPKIVTPSSNFVVQ
jgi:hypothetical protein